MCVKEAKLLRTAALHVFVRRFVLFFNSHHFHLCFLNNGAHTIMAKQQLWHELTLIKYID